MSYVPPKANPSHLGAELPKAEIAVAHMHIRTGSDPSMVILRDLQLGEAGEFPAAEVAQALAQYFWQKF